jgi:alpha/beta superfamily hydrolase
VWIQKRFGSGICAVIERNENKVSEPSLLVTLSGLGQAMSEKNYLFSNLRKRLALRDQWVVQFDYRGYGDSCGELHDATLQTMLSDALEVLQAVTANVSPQKIYFVGNMLGAVIAQQAALEWEQRTNIPCIPILISPLLKKMPDYRRLFSQQAIKLLDSDGYVDSQLLVPGYDYYTLNDFNWEQYQYFAALGAHMLYLHGQCIAKELLEQLNEVNPLELFNQSLHGVHLINGEQDQETIQLSAEIKDAKVYTLADVRHFYNHPKAMDQLIDIIQSIVETENKQILINHECEKGWGEHAND